MKGTERLRALGFVDKDGTLVIPRHQGWEGVYSVESGKLENLRNSLFITEQFIRFFERTHFMITPRMLATRLATTGQTEGYALNPKDSMEEESGWREFEDMSEGRMGSVSQKGQEDPEHELFRAYGPLVDTNDFMHNFHQQWNALERDILTPYLNQKELYRNIDLTQDPATLADALNIRRKELKDAWFKDKKMKTGQKHALVWTSDWLQTVRSHTAWNKSTWKRNNITLLNKSTGFEIMTTMNELQTDVFELIITRFL